MIYVIYVQSGREHDVVATLRDKNINAYAPAHDLLERKGGVWRMVRRMIFPTYVFVNSEGITYRQPWLHKQRKGDYHRGTAQRQRTLHC